MWNSIECFLMSITPDWIKISALNFMGIDASRPCGDNHVTKSRNRKLIRVTSSNKSQKHKCVDLSDYNIIFEPNLIQSTNMSTNITLSTCRNNQIHITWKSKMAAAAILDFGKTSITPDRINISCIKVYGIVHWTLAYTTACTTVQPVITACMVVQAVLTVWTVVSCSNNFNTKLGSDCWATGAPQKLCGPRTAYHVLRTLNSVTATEM